ncbi:MAG: hypothetical protein EP329_19630 [Deltaproteobacteria bacterium]|nr:MAG: hypothetical protein EP329_19630 [Deltaproteobacteria bacterium]
MTLKMLPLVLLLSVASIAACGKKDTTPAAPATQEGAIQPATDPAKPEDPKAGEPAATTPAVDPAKTEEPGEPARLTGAVAKVNGVEIAADAFYAERDKITARGTKIPPDRLARIEQNILKRLIEKELIDQAVKSAGVEVPAADIEAGFDEYKKRFQSDEQFENYLKHGRVTKESIEERIKDRRALELLLEKQGDMAVDDAAAKEFYEKNERFYTEKAGVRASHILIKLAQNASKEDEAKAMEKVNKAQEMLKGGEDFGEVAKKMSEGPTAPKGGDLGFFGEGRMVKEFQDAAFAMNVGDVSEPVRTRFGFHIIKVTDKREDRKKSFDEVKEQIVKSLKNKKFFTERRKLLADLEKNAKVEKFLPDPPAPAAGEAPQPGMAPEPAAGVEGTPEPIDAPAPEGGHEGHGHE